MNTKMMTLVFFELYTVYIEYYEILTYPYLLVNLFQQIYIGSVKNYNKFKQVQKLSINGFNFFAQSH